MTLTVHLTLAFDGEAETTNVVGPLPATDDTSEARVLYRRVFEAARKELDLIRLEATVDALYQATR